MDKVLRGKGPLKGEVRLPGDKSISHRTVMLGAIAEGVTRARGFLNGQDCLSTISCFRKMGINIELSSDNTEITVYGKGLRGLSCPKEILDCGNSGTTTRLLSGILSGQNFESVLTGDESIRKRPMKRIISPLSQMGSVIESVNQNGCAPLRIRGGKLKGIEYDSHVASAQVKSAILFAGLYAEGETIVREPYLSRDHSERMLLSMGAHIKWGKEEGGAKIFLVPPERLYAPEELIQIPGDISSAAFFLAGALLVKGSGILIRNVGINPTRDGILEVLSNMGADIKLHDRRMSGCEEVCDIEARYSHLKGVNIGGELIPRLIDELPVIAALAASCEGDTVISDAQELKVKESDRIAVMAEGLRRLGVSCEETESGMIIHGKGEDLRLKEGIIDTRKDHRIAMSFAVLSLISEEKITIKDADCVNISYPGFFGDLERLVEGAEV